MVPFVGCAVMAGQGYQWAEIVLLVFLGFGIGIQALIFFLLTRVNKIPDSLKFEWMPFAVNCCVVTYFFASQLMALAVLELVYLCLWSLALSLAHHLREGGEG